MRKLLWAVLLASLAAMLPLLILRISNEQKNTHVLLAGEVTGYIAGTVTDETGAGRGSTPLDLSSAGFNAMIADESVFLEENKASLDTRRELDAFHQAGLEIILRLHQLDRPSSFYNKLEPCMERYAIRYLLAYPEPNEDTGPGQPAGKPGQTDPPVPSAPLAPWLNQHGLTLFLMENKAQNGFYDLPGLPALIPAAEYRINRAFSIRTSLLGQTGLENALFVWRRAVIDRNIRLLDISGAGSGGSSNPYARVNLHFVKALQTDLLDRGFSFSSHLQRLDTRIPGFVYRIPVLLNLASALLLYFTYLPTFRRFRVPGNFHPAVPILLLSGLCLLVLLPLTVRVDSGILLAYLAALIYPILSGVFLLRIFNPETARHTNLLKRYALPTAAILGTCLAGAAVVLASMADIRYTMHRINFNIVSTALLLPPAVFVLHYFMDRGPALRQKVRSNSRLFLDFLGVVLLAGTLFLLIQRSGNDSLLPAQSAELEVRKLLETLLYTRPRSKEFLIGYPALFLYLFLQGRSAANRLQVFFGMLASLVSVSILNSFCHGFTPALVSLIRTAEALALGCISGAAVIAATRLFLKILPFTDIPGGSRKS